MKKRKGFVSNSSSSSYLLCFPEKIDSKKSLDKYVHIKHYINKDFWGNEIKLDFTDFLWNNCKDITDSPDAYSYLEAYASYKKSEEKTPVYKSFLTVELGQDAMIEGDTLENRLSTCLLEDMIYKVIEPSVIIYQESHH